MHFGTVPKKSKFSKSQNSMIQTPGTSDLAGWGRFRAVGALLWRTEGHAATTVGHARGRIAKKNRPQKGDSRLKPLVGGGPLQKTRRAKEKSAPLGR